MVNETSTQFGGQPDGSELSENLLQTYAEAYVNRVFIRGQDDHYISLEQFKKWMKEHLKEEPLPPPMNE
ncbi:hypothetical protein Pmar_PMAR004755 [Perkinsus marinus ATCC 50983]|uniref:Uncharacterized protein n=1 Tax=Perkinsus marinus (strain ATCC 50983 / TXsc) TaxID=423536 RepID=C5LL67_PERM5|nr:hypothetical protein Pmar_PMAR004755 [Perkinsus marinus ATCC 50983]EER02526.1 hypothetical protein Pmar_PMAR004755 [Perkinsus marinus ATCC 50983]|eukprot:XP_002769808.1 hypothetical protein Pmar_PMAR004755 [Perkinsus marinus ATCC 50983]